MKLALFLTGCFIGAQTEDSLFERKFYCEVVTSNGTCSGTIFDRRFVLTRQPTAWRRLVGLLLGSFPYPSAKYSAQHNKKITVLWC